MLRRSLRQRVVVLVLVAVAAVVLVTDVAVTVSLREAFQDVIDRTLAARVALVEELDGRPPASVEATLSLRGVPAVVTAPDGRRLETRPFGEPLPLGEFETTQVRLSDGTTVEVLVALGAAESAQQRVLATTIAGSLLAVAAAAVLLTMLGDRILRPLDEVIATARAIAHGRTGARLGPEHPDTEIGRLGRAFDEMLDAQEAALLRAREAELASRRFLADAAHQLRTPVAGLRAASEALFADPSTPDRERLLAHLAREAARTGRLLDALLRVAHLDRGSAPARAPVDLVVLLAEEVERQHALAPRLDVELTAPARLTVDADADGLREAVANLLDNARRHARQRIDVEVTADADTVRVGVRDDGPGLRPGEEEAVFERFVSRDDRGGSGLGLPIARGVARAHGGDVRWWGGRFELTIERRGV